MTNDAPNVRFPHLFVVARLDESFESGPVDERVSLVSAFESREMADQEAGRLEVLAGDRPWRYVVMLTRLKGPSSGNE